MSKRFCHILLLFDAFLGIAHLLWPEYRWGQGRYSYFYFTNSLTLASWLISVQLMGVAVLSLIAFHRERYGRRVEFAAPAWLWLSGVSLVLFMSFTEITRIHIRFRLLVYPEAGVYEQFIFLSIGLIFLGIFGWFLLHKLRRVPDYYLYGIGWLVAWGLYLGLAVVWYYTDLVPRDWHIGFTLVMGLAHLIGTTLLLTTLGGYVLSDRGETPHAHETLQEERADFPEGRARAWIYIGVGGVAFSMIFLQIILFQLLTIFGDYLAAHSVISIALMGLSVGGVVGFYAAHKAPLHVMVGASLFFPLSILLAFGAVVTLMDTPLIASLLLMIPFVFGGIAITIPLVRSKSQLVYFVDLCGAGAGAMLVSTALSHFREESGLLFLSAFAFLVALCFIVPFRVRRVRALLITLALVGFVNLLAVGGINLKSDMLNVMRKKIVERYPQAEVLFSRSSFVGRVDIMRMKPGRKNLKLYENGRVIDTIRPVPAENHRIDPRLPHTLMKDPIILILGLSGDGIIKTSRALGKKVYGVEVNPDIVNLQTKELREFNAHSYEGIDVSVMDGRNYIEKSDQRYDMITLMNSHFARGSNEGRSPSPEYLYTYKAMESYLDHLTDRGAIIIEEPINRPAREPPVLKMLVTMRRVLLDRGVIYPERHFFIFQWKTKGNNYVQILMKKEPLSKEDIAKLKMWVKDVDDIKKIEARLGSRVGPIRPVKTTILHSPDGSYSTNYSRILRWEVSEDFLSSYNLAVVTDGRPFLFDVNPAHPRLISAYGRTLLIILLLSPFFLSFMRGFRSELRSALSHLFTVLLTGVAFFLVEIVLLQRYELFIGSPIVNFATVLGTLLIFSGLGSLWSGRLRGKSLYAVLGVIPVLMMLQIWLFPYLFRIAAPLPLSGKVVLAFGSLAPLGLFMGVPFPYVMRSAKERFSQSSVAVVFALNAAGSALAVPLAFNLSTGFGLNITFQTALLLYVLAGLLLASILKQRAQTMINLFAILVMALLMISPWLARGPIAGSEELGDKYHVYGVSYGSSRFRHDKVFLGGSNAKRVPFEWLFWVIEGNNRTILVDTGFEDRGMVKKWRLIKYVPPLRRLKQLGISPAEVSDIILTHAHWDHMGGLAPYKNARIWIQEEEYLHALSTVNSINREAKGMRWRDLAPLLAAEKEGRLIRVKGDRELAPGVSMVFSGDHTPGSQYVVINTLDGPLIISGDTTYTYRNNRWHIPIGSLVNDKANLETIREMHRRAASPFFILPGHDPLVMKLFPKVSNGVVHVTMGQD